ncbi:MAG: hypothetical protein HY321_00615, partial [Armatimonadetes bacterium]|nr:hypothetical protein [Armatimonadota bacterium]
VFSATVYDQAGKTMARGTKMETARGFADYIEKSETGAIGRALALCGFGTQFAPELEEGERIVDAPHPVGTPARVHSRGAVYNVRGGAPPASGAKRPDAGDGGNGAQVCSEPECGRAMTQGQYEFSIKSFGRALCPQCQK